MKLFYRNERSLNQISNDTHNSIHSISLKTVLYGFCFEGSDLLYIVVYVYGTITTRISKLKVIYIMYSC